MTVKQLVPMRLAKLLSNRTEQFAYNDRARYYPEPDLTNLDDAGQPILSNNYSEIWCSFTDSISRQSVKEEWSDLADIGMVTADIRVSEIIPNKGGRFELISKWNLDLQVTKIYEVIDIKDRGSFGYICALKDVSI